MREGADRHPRVDQEVDDDAPNPAGRSGDEHRRHPRPCHEDLDVLRDGRTESIMPLPRVELLKLVTPYAEIGVTRH
jgi:hypothetical protein